MRADDLHARRHGCDDAGGEPATADGHDDDLDARQVFDDLEADRPLARDHHVIIERVDERSAPPARQALGVAKRRRIVDSGEHHLRAVAAGRFDLGDGRALGHHDRGLHAGDRRRVGDALRMVTGRCRDDAARSGAIPGRPGVSAVRALVRLRTVVRGTHAEEFDGHVSILSCRIRIPHRVP